MRSDLPALARELGADERTLRRAVARGAVHGHRPGPRRLELSAAERRYLVDHWPLLARLTEALRTHRDVRLAVLFGSVARGDESEVSDLDVLVELHDGLLDSLRQIRRRLRDATQREVQIVSVDAATTSPSLMADVVRDGRVLVDRDRAWPAWRERAASLRAAASRESADAESRARTEFAYYARMIS